MANMDLNNFLHSLAIWMVGRAAAQDPPVTINYQNAGKPRALFRNSLKEPTQTAGVIPNQQPMDDPASVLRFYMGSKVSAKDPMPRRSIQCMTTGKSEDAAMLRAEVLYETLLYDASDPMLPLAPQSNVLIDGFSAIDDTPDGQWLIQAFVITNPPGKAGFDLRDRPLMVFNFDVGFVHL